MTARRWRAAASTGATMRTHSGQSSGDTKESNATDPTKHAMSSTGHVSRANEPFGPMDSMLAHERAAMADGTERV